MNRSKRSVMALISERLNIEKRKLRHIQEGITTKKYKNFNQIQLRILKLLITKRGGHLQTN